MKKIILFSLALLMFFAGPVIADSLKLETDYRLRGISYPNTDFDDTTASSDTFHYFSQRFVLKIIGNFPQGVEIGSKITALNVAGSTQTLHTVPYTSTNFSPYIENAYLKINNIAETPIDLTVGKINLEYADGILISDNGIGFTTIKFNTRYAIPIPFTNYQIPFKGELFTAKAVENITPDKDADLYGGFVAFDLRGHSWELGYYDERDYSGTLYQQGTLSERTKGIVKNYLDLSISKKDKISAYKFELITQGGSVTKLDGSHINFNGVAYLMSGKLIGEKTKLGRVEAKAFLQIFSGDDNTLSLGDSDESFNPTYTKKYDGLELYGNGELFSATPQGSFFPIPNNYSGINTLSLGADFSPIYAWTFGVYYYLYSASQGPRGAPPASGIERILGAEYSLGVEMNLHIKYVYSKYIDFAFSFCRYGPPAFATYWPKNNPAAKYKIEANGRF